MSDTKVFGREEILAAKTKRNVIKIEDVPGLGGSVYVREMKRAEFAEWIQRTTDPDAAIVARVLCDESGNLLFDPDNLDDIKLIEESFTTRGLAHIGMKAIVENSAHPEAVEKNLLASLNTGSSSS